MLSQTEHGKAYEYACLIAIQNYLKEHTNNIVNIEVTDAYNTAQKAFFRAELEGESQNLWDAANAAARVIFRLEPQLEFGNGTLTLCIQKDSKGQEGDVRDVVCIRASSGWEIGVSCKHNHHAVKHSRLSATIDFGLDWLGIPCSRQYFDSVTPIFNELKMIRAIAMEEGSDIPLWKNIPDKAEKYYFPVLTAFIEEMKKLCEKDREVPGRLIMYMLGRYDFYKVMTDDKHRTTTVQAVNIAGSLNRPANGHMTLVDVPKVKLPKRIYHMGFVPGSNNTVEIVCDEGWTLNLRIHSAKKEVEPSLKFDVQLVSLPASVHSQVEPWDNY